jgi:hypothetical protein
LCKKWQASHRDLRLRDRGHQLPVPDERKGWRA